LPRLDVWLVERGRFLSRQAAKRAINNGLVTVNGQICKPSTKVSEKDKIELLSSEIDVPQGFLKLKELDQRLEDTLVSKNCMALDIGSSAGGFLVYLAEKGASVVGIEVSERFTEELNAIMYRYSLVSVIFADAFHIDLNTIVGNRKLDLLLIDVTTDPEGTLKLIERFTPLLKETGRMLSAFKLHSKSEKLAHLKTLISQLGYAQVQEIILDETRQEVHITAIHL
jgi:23S rRNA (cytidine1920-2'-O)/16S rRNA (cytidine1409-2'-O)-methyltransferase